MLCFVQYYPSNVGSTLHLAIHIKSESLQVQPIFWFCGDEFVSFPGNGIGGVLLGALTCPPAKAIKHAKTVLAIHIVFTENPRGILSDPQTPVHRFSIHSRALRCRSSDLPCQFAKLHVSSMVFKLLFSAMVKCRIRTILHTGNPIVATSSDASCWSAPLHDRKLTAFTYPCQCSLKFDTLRAYKNIHARIPVLQTFQSTRPPEFTFLSPPFHTPMFATALLCQVLLATAALAIPSGAERFAAPIARRNAGFSYQSRPKQLIDAPSISEAHGSDAVTNITHSKVSYTSNWAGAVLPGKEVYCYAVALTSIMST